ncbi:MAG: helix-turn-helix domain-containing protein [Thaumarchaeota archaeon]|nr:helix-turn-helix domain-containing protein [Nitrososphaerota archaeon]
MRQDVSLDSLEKIESLEVLSFLKSTPDEVALICKVRFKVPATRVEDVFADKFEEMQVLEQDGADYTCFFKERRPSLPSGGSPIAAGGYLSIPYEIKDGRIKATFLGSAKEVRGVLDSLEKAALRYKVLSLTDARFSPDSPLSRLTEKQRKVILSAFNLGYYDVPRRVSSEGLARRLNIREPTLVMHRRKAERRLLAALVRES